MKPIFVTLFLFISMFCVAQDSTVQGTDVRLLPLDKSPMDMAYFPDEYPVLNIKDKVKDPPVARVIYGRPQKAGRTVFGDLVEYGKVWRLGANEPTEIEFYKDVNIGGKKVPKGKYTLYALVNPTQWTVILNKDTDTWGAFKYDDKKDFLRVPVSIEKEPQPVEAFTMYFDKTTNGANLQMAWDSTKATLPIVVK